MSDLLSLLVIVASMVAIVLSALRWLRVSQRGCG